MRVFIVCAVCQGQYPGPWATNRTWAELTAPTMAPMVPLVAVSLICLAC